MPLQSFSICVGVFFYLQLQDNYNRWRGRAWHRRRETSCRRSLEKKIDLLSSVVGALLAGHCPAFLAKRRWPTLNFILNHCQTKRFLRLSSIQLTRCLLRVAQFSRVDFVVHAAAHPTIQIHRRAVTPRINGSDRIGSKLTPPRGDVVVEVTTSKSKARREY